MSTITKTIKPARKNYGERIVANNIKISNDTFKTGINNNDLVIGSSGSGKTMGYVIPNILNTTDSFVVVDTKSQLFKRTANRLKKKGYAVHLIDFKNPENSTIGYNPFDFIKTKKNGEPKDLEIFKLSTIINPATDHAKEPYWALAAQKYCDAVSAYMMTAMQEDERNMIVLNDLATLIGSSEWNAMLERLESIKPECLAVKRNRYIQQTTTSDKTHASIVSILNSNLAAISAEELEDIYCADERIDFRDLGRRKTALFVNISDSDRSMDRLLNLFYTQIFNELMNSADEEYEDGRLKVPVRLFLDDFASNFVIPDFDKIVTTIRSRDIYASIMIQSIAQLSSMYGHDKAVTIIDNCEVQLYLGGQNVETAEYFSKKANKPLDRILQMPRGKMWLFVSGKEAALVDKYDFIKAMNEDAAESNEAP